MLPQAAVVIVVSTAYLLGAQSQSAQSQSDAFEYPSQRVSVGGIEGYLTVPPRYRLVDAALDLAMYLTGGDTVRAGGLRDQMLTAVCSSHGHDDAGLFRSPCAVKEPDYAETRASPLVAELQVRIQTTESLTEATTSVVPLPIRMGYTPQDVVDFFLLRHGMSTEHAARNQLVKQVTVELQKQALSSDDLFSSERRGRQTLKQVFDEQVADKGSVGHFPHHYFHVYDTIFAGLEKQPSLRMLEIGVGSGASVLAWLRYFSGIPDFLMHAIDTDLSQLSWLVRRRTDEASSQGRLVLHEGWAQNCGSGSNGAGGSTQTPSVKVENHGSTEAVASPPLLKAADPSDFDVIIDDGDHHTKVQLEVLQCYWPRLRRGGWYVIEDLFLDEDDPNNFQWRDLLPVTPADHPLLNASTPMPGDVNKILSENTHFHAITKVEPRDGRLHMMMVIRKD